MAEERTNNTRFSVGERYLLQFNQEIGFKTQFDEETQWVRGRGELQVRVVEPAGDGAYFAVDSFGIVGNRISFGGEDSGTYSLATIGGDMYLQGDGDSGRLELNLESEFVYRYLETKLGFEQIDDDLFRSPTEKFTGNMSGSVYIESSADGVSRFDLIESVLTLKYQENGGGLGLVNQIHLPLSSAVFMRLGEPALPSLMYRSFDNATESDALRSAATLLNGNVRRLKIRRVGFWDNARGVHTGEIDLAYVQRLFDAAQLVWGKACIRFDVLDSWHVINDATLATGNDVGAVANSYDDPVPDVIEVFFVNASLSGLGGGVTRDLNGATFQPNHSLARIVLSNDDKGNDTLLAHELGHVLSGVHSGIQLAGSWEGEWDTILDSNYRPFLERNTESNCLNARNPSLYTDPNQSCFMQPDA